MCQKFLELEKRILELIAKNTLVILTSDLYTIVKQINHDFKDSENTPCVPKRIKK